MIEKTKAMIDKNKVIQNLRAYQEKNRIGSFIVHEDPNYVTIKEIGKEALPVLFDCIEEYPWVCFSLIITILKRRPDIHEKLKGRLEPLKTIYANWRKVLQKEGEFV